MAGKAKKWISEIRHAHFVLHPNLICGQLYSADGYVNDLERQIRSASLLLYFGKHGMTDYYRITFYSGYDGVLVTKANSKSICYYGFNVGNLPKDALQHDFRNFGIPYEDAINYSEDNKFNGQNLWFWHGNAIWEELPFEEIMSKLVILNWDVYNVIENENEYAKNSKKARLAAQNLTNLCYKRRFIRVLEKYGLVSKGLVEIPPIDFSEWDEKREKALEDRRKYVEMNENGTLPDDFEYNPLYPYY